MGNLDFHPCNFTMSTLSQFLLGLLCLTLPAVANPRDLSSPVLLDISDPVPVNASVDTASELFGTDFLSKRNCNPGYGLCRYSGRCCPEPTDACCEDGTCIQKAIHYCCSRSGRCPIGELCCSGGCIPGGADCCSEGHYCPPGKKCCHDGCIPEADQCCRSGGYCRSPNQCYVYLSGEQTCCPEAGCYSDSQIIYWYYYVYWYIMVYYEVTIEVTTSTLSLTSSRESTSTELTLTAENSASVSSMFEELSSSLSAAAQTTPNLADLPTMTTTSTSSTSTSTTSTTTARPTSSLTDDEPSVPTPSESSESVDLSSLPTASSGDEIVSGGGTASATGLSAYSVAAYLGLAGVSFFMMVLL
ncbi:hypothetical protein BJX61DRAFT_508048 [Aspergillus egyptiacus]|nr:hypothetical protein BJX61DRAFT_508048 [Aspergillus egyptiacus]